jgi:predicted HTH domain antitoxin
MIQVQFPKPVEDELRRAFGEQFDRQVCEAVIVEGFRTAKLSIGQAAKMLGLTVEQANGFMKQRGVQQDGPTLEEVEREAAELADRVRRSRGA